MLGKQVFIFSNLLRERKKTKKNFFLIGQKNILFDNWEGPRNIQSETAFERKSAGKSRFATPRASLGQAWTTMLGISGPQKSFSASQALTVQVRQCRSRVGHSPGALLLWNDWC